MKRILILISIAAALFSCSEERFDQDWKKFVHPPNWHRCDPFPVQGGEYPKLYELQMKFDSSCEYRFVNSDGSIQEDQYDYNKAGGWTFKFVSSEIHSCLVGWRWGIESRSIELTFYHHSNKTAVHFSDPVLTCGFYDLVTYTMVPNYTTGEIYERLEANGKVVENRFTMPYIIGYDGKEDGREVQCWFGGQKKAPHRIVIFKKQKRLRR